MRRPNFGPQGIGVQYNKDARTNGLREELGHARYLSVDPRITPENKIGLLNKVERLEREVERREGRR